MIYVMSSGSKAFAVIVVTYPAGSVCTCSDGIKTLELKDTGGQGFFLIPYAATWTVTATDGTNTKAQSVEITSEGQSESVAIQYLTYIYQQGVTDIELYKEWGTPPDSDAPINKWINSGNTALNSDGTIQGEGGCVLRARKVDLTDINELFFEAKNDPYSGYGTPTCGVANTWPYANAMLGFAASTALPADSEVHTIKVDVSSLSGEYWVGVNFASLTTSSLYNIWY